MSEMKHTPEPWIFQPESETIRSKKENYWIVSVNSWDAAVNNKANAERITACVNSCKNVPNEWLQENAIYALIDERDKLKRIIIEDIDAMAKLQEDRDSILKALLALTDAIKTRTSIGHDLIHEMVEAEKVIQSLKAN